MRTLSRPYYLAAVFAASMLVSTCARANGLQDSLEACRQLQDGPLPIGCSVLTGATPTFLFGLSPRTDTDEATLAVISVIAPACAVLPIRVVLMFIAGGEVQQATATHCADSELGEWTKLDPATLKPTVY